MFVFCLFLFLAPLSVERVPAENPTFNTLFWFRQYLVRPFVLPLRLSHACDPALTTQSIFVFSSFFFFTLDLFLYWRQAGNCSGLEHFAFRNCEHINSRCAIDYYYLCFHNNKTRDRRPIRTVPRRRAHREITENVSIRRHFVAVGDRHCQHCQPIERQRTNINILIDVRILHKR